MAYSEFDLEIIKSYKPDLKTRPRKKYSLDEIIIEFLKKYEFTLNQLLLKQEMSDKLL